MPNHRHMHLISTFISTLTVLTVLNAGCAEIKTAPERGSENVRPVAVLPVPSSRKATGPSGVLLSYDFAGAGDLIGDGGCRVRLINRDTKKSVFLTLLPDATAAFMKLEPGTYETGRMGCGMTQVWDLDNVYPAGFQVETGSVSYIGQLNFIFANSKGKKRTLTEVRKASRVESAQAFERSQKVSEPNLPLVSGFTLKPVSLEMARNGLGGDGKGGFNVQAKGAVIDTPKLESLLNQLKSCEMLVAARDPLRLGRLDYLAQFTQGKFVTFKERKDENAFSDEFRSCVAQSLSEFRVPPGSAVEIHVVY